MSRNVDLSAYVPPDVGETQSGGTGSQQSGGNIHIELDEETENQEFLNGGQLPPSAGPTPAPPIPRPILPLPTPVPPQQQMTHSGGPKSVHVGPQQQQGVSSVTVGTGAQRVIKPPAPTQQRQPPPPTTAPPPPTAPPAQQQQRPRIVYKKPDKPFVTVQATDNSKKK